MAQALIQQRFYVGAYRRFYERLLRINFESSKLQFYMQLTVVPWLGVLHVAYHSARGRGSACHAAEH
ncbi:hypothetical protein ABH892_004848 [Paenibacillus sp. RC254]|uniref:hypothetical protein n=1 Tax=unclassified Paenibacillus TaxID=185978 RepID=UPI0024BB4BEF|nr:MULTISPECIES: hypothetical protein [unclassified Paenibacillus]